MTDCLILVGETCLYHFAILNNWQNTCFMTKENRKLYKRHLWVFIALFVSLSPNFMSYLLLICSLALCSLNHTKAQTPGITIWWWPVIGFVLTADGRKRRRPRHLPALWSSLRASKSSYSTAFMAAVCPCRFLAFTWVSPVKDKHITCIVKENSKSQNKISFCLYF